MKLATVLGGRCIAPRLVFRSGGFTHEFVEMDYGPDGKVDWPDRVVDDRPSAVAEALTDAGVVLVPKFLKRVPLPAWAGVVPALYVEEEP